MKDKQNRKREVINSLLRRENWELEAIKSDNARAQRLLARESQALGAAKDTLEATYADLRRLMDGDALEIDALQKLNVYLARISREQSECQARQRHLQAEADKITVQLKRKLLFTKGLATIEAGTTQELNNRREKTVQRDTEELWLQRRGKRK